MKAIIEVKKGESIYKIIRSPWLKDSDGPVMFKLLSKKRRDGQIEAVFLTERSGGIKHVLTRAVNPEEKFMDVANAFREAVWQFFPDVDLAVEEVEPIDADKPHSTSQYTAVRPNKKGLLWLRIKKWLRL
jgi:hypothetical protein